MIMSRKVCGRGTECAASHTLLSTHTYTHKNLTKTRGAKWSTQLLHYYGSVKGPYVKCAGRTLQVYFSNFGHVWMGAALLQTEKSFLLIGTAVVFMSGQ